VVPVSELSGNQVQGDDVHGESGPATGRRHDPSTPARRVMRREKGRHAGPAAPEHAALQRSRQTAVLPHTCKILPFNCRNPGKRLPLFDPAVPHFRRSKIDAFVGNCNKTEKYGDACGIAIASSEPDASHSVRSHGVTGFMDEVRRQVCL